MPYLTRLACGVSDAKSYETNKDFDTTFFAEDEKRDAYVHVGKKIEPRADGCWIYNGQPDVYGIAHTKAGQVTVHRFVYETIKGDIPAGYFLHHECHTPGCCNPDHLTPMLPGDHTAHHAALRRASTST